MQANEAICFFRRTELASKALVAGDQPEINQKRLDAEGVSAARDGRVCYVEGCRLFGAHVLEYVLAMGLQTPLDNVRAAVGPTCLLKEKEV